AAGDQTTSHDPEALSLDLLPFAEPLGPLDPAQERAERVVENRWRREQHDEAFRDQRLDDVNTLRSDETLLCQLHQHQFFPPRTTGPQELIQGNGAIPDRARQVVEGGRV